MSTKTAAKNSAVIDTTYFTNLVQEQFPSSRIVELYHVQRWDNGNRLFRYQEPFGEAERFNSGKYNIVTNEIYGKILCFTLCGCFYEAAGEKEVQKHHGEGQLRKYDYIPNMKYIVDTVRTEYRLLQHLAGSKNAFLRIGMEQLSCQHNRRPLQEGGCPYDLVVIINDGRDGCNGYR